jgi:hypothetical protein
MPGGAAQRFEQTREVFAAVVGDDDHRDIRM